MIIWLELSCLYKVLLYKKIPRIGYAVWSGSFFLWFLILKKSLEKSFLKSTIEILLLDFFF